MLTSPRQWISTRFSADDPGKPHPSTVRRWVEAGELPGKKIGGRYYVEIDEEQKQTGNDLVDRILKAS